MKEFNLEEAKSGVPICTREGKDAEFMYIREGESYPITVRIYYATASNNTFSITEAYNEYGKAFLYREDKFDLMMK